MNQNSAILKTRFNLLKNMLVLLPREPILKVTFVLSFILAFLAGAFFLFLRAFKFFDSLGGVGLVVISRLFYLFFMGLFLMLIASNMIVSYAALFRSEEIRFLFKYPITYTKVFIVKFLESIGLSSWAFFFIIGPFLCAFGVHGGLGLSFYLATVAFFIPLLFLAALLGSLLMMLLLKVFPRIKIFLYTLAGLLVVLLIFKGQPADYSAYQGSSFFLRRLVPYVSFSHSPLLPNFWVAEGITAVTQGRIKDALFWWLLLFSNVCMGTLVVHSLAKRIYYFLWERIQSPQTTKVYARSLVDGIIGRLKFISPTSRVMLSKDVKLFYRDPVQWSQFLIFFGILGIYFGNLQSYSYHLYSPMWKALISFLNIFATALILASLGARFIYPQLTLEGKSFWVLGLAPVSFKKILLQKFWMSLVFSLAVSVTLIVLSNWMLQVSGLIWLVSLALIILACIALVGLSCGLGAIFADFRIKNPAAIFSGFGGTLNLVLNLIYLLLSVGVVGGIFHFYSAGKIAKLIILKKYLIISGVGVAILSIVACVVPLYLGTRALKKKEY